MDEQRNILGTAGLQFFGKMSASLSHELKNVLATMNEDAGLIQDYSALALEGRPLDPERMKAIAGKIRDQVQRADRMVKNLNRLAHSVDAFEDRINVAELVTFLIVLCRRIASVRGITLEWHPPDVPVSISTHPFFLKNLLWLCLDFAMAAAGEGKRVALSVEKKGEGVGIIMRGLEAMVGAAEGAFPSEKVRALLDAVGGECRADGASGELEIILAGNGRSQVRAG